ncbi:MAG TPA: metallophosphoesterase [Vicinamibacterales bacterium]|jgi:predicted MPP superfamily phosphohydrolase|nr:metallophosphoesterase [Vicinamibacterales bacterium]
MLQERKVSRRVVLKGAIGTSVGLLVGSAGYGYFYERHRLQITRASLPISGLPDALNGLRVALVTDTHFSRSVPAEDIEAAVRLTLQERPDLIILGGDYVTWGGDAETKGDRGYVGGSAELLAPLTAPHGVFAILGNHDDDRDMPEALTARGFTVLRDARTRVTIRGEPLEIAGIRYWTRRIEHIARVLRGATATTILLAHDPRRLIEAASLNVGAVFSGHTHGGQIVVPGVGPIAARRFPVIAGAGRRENTSIFVSRGIGTVYLPVRLNCPPEVAIVELESRSIPVV